MRSIPPPRVAAEKEARDWVEQYAFRRLAALEHETESLEILARFIEHRMRLASARRLEMKLYLDKLATSPVNVSIATESASFKDGAGWVGLPFGLFNAWRKADWDFFFYDSPPGSIRWVEWTTPQHQSAVNFE
jgi:hypothetical protein